MRKRIVIGAAIAALLALYWHSWETGKEMNALQNQVLTLNSNATVAARNQQQIASALIELIRRTGHTNMIRQGP